MLLQYLIAFLEGVITFISPCLLPMIPIYISYFAGGGERTADKTLKGALGFVTGFTVVFVAMGSPKQELLMEEISMKHPAIYQGLGGSFDVYTGNVKRAPKWWVDHNLEWAYRLVKEPSRIKRQIHLVRFLALVKLGRI